MEGWGGEDGPLRVPSAHLSHYDSHCLKSVSRYRLPPYSQTDGAGTGAEAG